MTLLDYAVIIIYMAGIISIGSLGFIKQKGLKDYFLGERKMPWLASMATLIASGISAITFIGMPALSFKGNLTDLQIYLGVPLAALLAAWIVVPFFYRQDIISAYEFLERRFDIRCRLFASLVFQLQMILILGTIIAAPAKVLSELSGLSFVVSVLIVGTSTAIYTVIGGLRAVIWTDAIQLVLLVAGPILALGILVYKLDGGLATIVDIGRESNKFRLFDTSFDLHTEVTIWAAFTGLVLYNLAGLTTSQENVQKYLSAKSIKESRRAVIYHGFGLLALWILFFFIGIALFAFHQTYPDRLPATQDNDRIFVRFILNEIPMGLRGLVICGIFAAAMANISSQLNAFSAVAVVDVWRRFFLASTKGREVLVSRLMTIFGAVSSLVAAIVVVRWGGVVKTGLVIGNFLSGPVLTMFLAGMFLKRTNGKGVFLGSVLSLVTVAYVALFTNISWAWHTLIGTLVGMLSGQLFSLLFSSVSSDDQESMTITT